MNWKEKGGQWLPVLAAAESANGIPADLLCRLCRQESDFNPAARNRASGAIGLMQLLPRYFLDAGISGSRDITTAARYLATNYKRFGRWDWALAAYNWGPGNVSAWVKKGAKFTDLPGETRNYITQITADVPLETPVTEQPESIGWSPSSSTSGSLIGGALSTILIAILKQHGIDIDATTGGAIVMVLSALVGYLPKSGRI